jgi:hypothetical protein
MGQNLFSPPNVKGWPGGEAWINTSTLLARKAFLDRLFRAEDALVTAAGDAPAAMSPPPKQTVAANAAEESDDARRIRFMRAIERGLKSVRFDSDAWLAELGTDERSRAGAAMRLLLAYAPQAAPDPSSPPLALVRQIVLDAAYQLK